MPREAECRRRWWVLTVLLAATFVSHAVSARSNGRRATDRRDAGRSPGVVETLWVTPRATLAAPAPGELLLDALVQSAPLADLLHGASSVGAVLTRELESVWELRVPADLVPERLHVTYELIAANGRTHDLRTVGSGGSGIPVRVRGTPPVLVRREGDFAIVRGGAVLQLDVGSARHSGTYGGVLRVRIEDTGSP